MVVEDHSLPLVTVEVAVRSGAMVETPEYNGLSHLYEHMFFKANAVIPNQEPTWPGCGSSGSSSTAHLGGARELLLHHTSDHFDRRGLSCATPC